MFDPSFFPDPETWLALSEAERSAGLAAWHAENPRPVLHPAGADALHAAMHAAVETQIAALEPPTVAHTVARLVEESVDRHAAVHAVIECLMLQMHASINRPDGFDHAGYAADLTGLEAATIVARGLRRAAALEGRKGQASTGPNRAERRAAKRKKR